MKIKNGKESKIRRCIKAPMRVLGKARDFYVRTMNNLAGEIHSNSYPSAQITTLPRSFSAHNSSTGNREEDFRELYRVASSRSMGNKIELDSVRRQQFPISGGDGGRINVVPRSQSVAIARIDEDHTCDFGDMDIYVKKSAAPDLFSRTRSTSAAAFTYK